MEVDSRILIFGGCHVQSDPPDGFIDILRRSFTQITPIAHIKASHARKIYCEITKHSPLIVVFQIGNFENPYPVFDRITKKATKIFRRRTTITISHKHPYPLWIPTPIKFSIDKLASLVGAGVANPYFYNRDFLRVLLVAKKLIGANLIVLSPFPSTDDWMHYGRLKANRSMKRMCLDLDIKYVDLFEHFTAPLQKYFQYKDAFHLNKEGCALLAHVVESELLATLSVHQSAKLLSDQEPI